MRSVSVREGLFCHTECSVKGVCFGRVHRHELYDEPNPVAVRARRAASSRSSAWRTTCSSGGSALGACWPRRRSARAARRCAPAGLGAAPSAVRAAPPHMRGPARSRPARAGLGRGPGARAARAPRIASTLPRPDKSSARRSCGRSTLARLPARRRESTSSRASLQRPSATCSPSPKPARTTSAWAGEISWMCGAAPAMRCA